MNLTLRPLVLSVALTATASSTFAADAFISPLQLGTLGSTPAAVFADPLFVNPLVFSYGFRLASSVGRSDLIGALRFWDPVDLTVTLASPSFSQTISVAGSVNISNAFKFESLADGNYVISFTGYSTLSSTSRGGGYIQALSPVPEPNSIALLFAGIGVAAVLLHRRKTA